MLHTVIMAGGSGTRFWPQSRRALPKQFLSIGTDQTLIRETAERCFPLSSMERTWVVTGAAHADETLRQLPVIPAENLLIEPCARNTAPCIGLAAVQLVARDPDATMLVVPADHVIAPNSEFIAAAQSAAEFLEQHPEKLLLFGVLPTAPATGFGYIQLDAALDVSHEVYTVRSFREKPDLTTATRYLTEGGYLWNCGIFLWKASTILAAIAQYQPEMGQRLQRLQAAVGQPNWDDELATEFPQMASLSIDYAVLEHASQVCVRPAPFQWDDVGSWQALARLVPADDNGNTIQAQHCGLETRDCIIRGTPGHLIATMGVHDLIIVQTPEVTLVARRGDEAEVKALLAEVERRGLAAYL